MNMEDEEEEKEEEEDADFSPFSRDESPSEASSGLSSDGGSQCDDHVLNEKLPSSSNQQGTKLSYGIDYGNGDGEIVMQGGFATKDIDGKYSVSEGPPETREPSKIEGSTFPEGNYKEGTSLDEGDTADQLMESSQATTSPNPVSSSKAVVETDNDDAICTRTRARHSLANYTLEELEAFLQESEDEDDLHNVDDEEEYGKFLAAVLLGVNDNGRIGQEDEGLDEDEENDADFVIELEEALDTDTDETADNNKTSDYKNEEDFHIHRPETRQKKRLKESVESKKHFLGQGKTPLRPILPHISNSQIAVAPPYGWQFSSPQNSSHCSSSLYVPDLPIGFTVQQIGQLYCLLHEHIQLLIQVYSVCVLDPSHQQVAMEAQKMINEMVVKHEQALALRKVPYDISCFQPSNLCASLQIDSHHTPGFSDWMPLIENPIFSILDLAPLRLAKNYMGDVSAIVLRHRQSHLEDPADRITSKREPLFPSPFTTSHGEIDECSLGRVNATSAKTASPGQLQPKKSLAAALVESTKKQTVTLVPKDIAKLAQRFYALFNFALYPHKPPAPSVANRVLFTDAEDGLLAMGLMKYNNDWGAIQKHLLPCKSKHQIFVRQKNRSSSKAPENPIKAVRRMKMSPLTAEEKARIYEGLKVFRHDWLSIWKFFVPHRDPSLLQRQWRIATGTQKSYRKTEAIKKKRRLYEAERRKLKSFKEVGNGGDSSGEEMENKNEAYVHEAFLADPEPGSSNNFAQDDPLSSICKINKQYVSGMLYSGTYCSWISASQTDDIGQSHREGVASSSLSASHGNFPLSHSVDVRNYHLIYPSNQNSSDTNLRTPGYQLGSFLARKSKGAHVVKLAPGLPPVNLPPSVRVIPQSEFKNCQAGSSHVFVSKNGTNNLASGSHVVPQAGSSKHVNRSLDTGLLESFQQMGKKPADQYVSEQNASESDLQMHPLLFQTPEDQFSLYYSVNSYATPSTAYNFLPPGTLHNDPELFRSQHLVTADSTNVASNLREAPSDMCTIDFHPLLRRSDNASLSSGIGSPADLNSGGATKKDDNAKLFSPSDCTMRGTPPNKNCLTTNKASSCSYDKENNLDLDLHFYSMASKENTGGKDASHRHQSDESSSHTKERHMAEKSAYVNMSLNLHANKFHEVAVSSHSVDGSRLLCEIDTGTSQCQDKGTSQCIADLYDDSTMQDIIMEQEELSDSEVESENIEFECEDLDDSSGEEWNSARLSELQDKEIPKTLALGEKSEASQHFSQSDQSISIRQGLVEEGKDCNTDLQTHQTTCYTKLHQLKPKRERAKRDRSSSSSKDVLNSDIGLYTRNQKPKNSRMQPSGPRQPHLRMGNECKNIASRKQRRPSLCK